MGHLKGKSMLMIYDRYPEQRDKWGKAFGAEGYYVSIVGNIIEEVIKKFIRGWAKDH